MTRHIKGLVRYLRNMKAVSALEYALLLGIIATVLATALIVLGGKMKGALVTVGNEVTEAAGEVDD